MWTGSRGSTTPRHEAVMRLHYLHFVKKSGNEKVHEVVEQRRKENRAQDAVLERTHRNQLKELGAAMDEKIKNAMKHGSMSVWKKEERDRIEEARQDPDEAREKMVQHMNDKARSFKVAKGAMTERVKAMPAMNVRPREEWQRIEDARQDPDEAKEKMTTHMKQLTSDFQKQKAEMNARVKASPRTTFWTKESRDRIEELRQDPDEALEKMTKHMEDLEKKSAQDKRGMMDRVYAAPPMNMRSKQEQDMIEEARQDPHEAKAKMESHMKTLRDDYKQQKADMTERVRALPTSMHRWTKEERDKIEQARQDPMEATEKMTGYSKELAESYREQKRAMNERVDATPAMTFRSKAHRDRLDIAKSLMKTTTPRV